MDTNWLAVVVAAVINMAIGTIWYMPAVFGKGWMAELGKKQGEMSASVSGYVLTAIAALVQSYLLAVLVHWRGADTFALGLKVGFVVWLGFVATTHLVNYVFEGKSVKLFTINQGYFLLTLLINAGLLATWK